MARRRMIDPNIWMSENVSNLTVFERLLLIGMISNADDEGRGRAAPALLRSIIFPYDDFAVQEIEQALTRVEQRINIVLYEVEGNQYYAFTKWDKWQRVDKPQPSIIPPYSDFCPDDYSKNDSENDSENDSRLKEKKRKEENIREEKYSCSEPETNSEPPVAELPLNDDSMYSISRADFDEMKSLYPGVNVLQQLRNMKGWLIANPNRRKTKSGIKRFIHSWLSKEQNTVQIRGPDEIKRTVEQRNNHPERQYDKAFFDSLVGLGKGES